MVLAGHKDRILAQMQIALRLSLFIACAWLMSAVVVAETGFLDRSLTIGGETHRYQVLTVDQSRRLAAALKAVRADFSYVEYPGALHVESHDKAFAELPRPHCT